MGRLRDTAVIYPTGGIRLTGHMARVVRAVVTVAIVALAGCGNDETERRPLEDRSKVFEHAISGHVPVSELPGTYESEGGHRLRLGEADEFAIERAGRTVDSGSYRAVMEGRRFEAESKACGIVTFTWDFVSGALVLSGEGDPRCRAARILVRAERWEPID